MSNIEKKIARILHDLGFYIKSYKLKHFLDPYNIFYFQFPEEKYVIDFAMIKPRIAIEIDGKYWHKKVKTIIRDERKEKILIERNWKLIRINEKEINNKSFHNKFISLVWSNFNL